MRHASKSPPLDPPPVTASRYRPRHRMKRSLAIGAAVAAALCLPMLFPMTLLQDRLLYLPSHAPNETTPASGLAPWPSSQDFRGLVAEPLGRARATAIVFHGNKGHAGDRGYYAQIL